METITDVKIPIEVLTRWAESCLHMNHLGTLIQRELPNTREHARAIEFTERARGGAWSLLNELFDLGANKPDGYCGVDRK